MSMYVCVRDRVCMRARVYVYVCYLYIVQLAVSYNGYGYCSGVEKYKACLRFSIADLVLYEIQWKFIQKSKINGLHNMRCII